MTNCCLIKILLVGVFLSVFFTVQSQPNNGFITTPSGLQYKISKQGKGEFPKSGNRLWLHYIGKLADGSVFASTIEKGEIDVYLGHGQLIKGWEEGLKLINAGGAITLIVPPDLAYGASGTETIPPNSTLTFEIALLQIDAGIDLKPYDITGLKAKKGKRGLKYYVVNEGTGPTAKIGDNAYVQYTAWLPDGTIFDSSLKRGKNVRITVGSNQVIEGWDMGLQLMNVGSRIKLVIPPKLAYGREGFKNRVAPNTTITLDLELVRLTPEIKVSQWQCPNTDTVFLENGLKFLVIDRGSDTLIGSTAIVIAHYSGYFTNGKLFDSSVKREEPIKFPVGQNAVVDGLDLAVRHMHKGGKYQLFVPSSLGYGHEGSEPNIPPDADLIFDLEILDVIP